MWLVMWCHHNWSIRIYTLHQPNGYPLHRGQRNSLGERRLKLCMRYHQKIDAFIDNPAYHALYKFDWTIRDLYAPKPNGTGGMSWPLTPPVGPKVEAAMISAEIITAELICPLGPLSFPPWTRDYDPKRPNWRSKQMCDLQTRSPG